MSMTYLKSQFAIHHFLRGTTLVAVLSATMAASMLHALAANISDADTCNAAVNSSEKRIVKATLSADDLNTLVSLADQAKSACDAGDFPKASKITTAIDDKLKQVSTQ